MEKATIILPTKEEEETIGETLNRIASLNLGLKEVIVVDDSDTSKTRDKAYDTWKSLKSDIPIRALRGVGNESPSIKFAIEKCNGGPIVVVDADGSQDYEIIPEMIEHLDKYDVVIGSRYCKGGHPGASTKFSGIGNDFARFVLKSDIKDLTGRFFACSKEIALENCRWLGRGEDSIEFTYNCFPKGTKIVVKKEHKNQYGLYPCYASENIENIKEGDYVVTYNEDTREKECKKVLSTFNSKTKELVKLKFSNNNSFSMTPNHPVFLIRRDGMVVENWTKASELKVGDSVLQLSYLGLKSHLFADRKLISENFGRSQWCKGKTKETDNRLLNAGRKISKTKKEKYELGELVPWNVGLTKETNDSLLNVSKKVAIATKNNRMDKNSTYNTEEYKSKFLRVMRETHKTHPSFSHEARSKRAIEIGKRPEIKELRSKVMKNNAKNGKLFSGEVVAGKSKLETTLWEFIQKNFPDDWGHTGEGSKETDWIGNDEIGYICFDFVNTKCNKTIEAYSDYHKIMNYGSVDKYKSYRTFQAKQRGYEVVFVHEDEIYGDFKKLFEKIENFSYNPNTEVIQVTDVEKYDCNEKVFNIEVEDNNNYFAYGVLVHNCEKKKLKIREIPFHYKPRTGGQSKTNIAKYLMVYFRRVMWLRLRVF